VRRLVWSSQGRQDFREVITYIADRNPPAAARVAHRIEQAADNLALAPTGRPGRVTGTYEKVVANLPYVIAYALGAAPTGEGILTILRIIHGARD
jgi:toxin ParE1/3/4